MPRFNVVICTHKPRSLLERTLRSFGEAQRPEGFEKIWVLENGSNVGQAMCAALAATLPVQYVNLPQPGKNRALAHAIDQIGDGLVLFSDDDVRVNREILMAYAAAANEHGPRTFFGGPLLVDCEQPPPNWLRKYTGESITGWTPDDPTEPLVNDKWFLGANVAMFAQDVRGVGNFDPNLGPGSPGNTLRDEVDMQERLLRAGCKPVYVPEAKVWHHVAADECTVAWTFNRHYRIWMSNAMAKAAPVNGKEWRGVPRWMWRHLWNLRLRALAANLIPDPEKRFKVQVIYHQWRGTMEGMRRRRLRDQTPVAPK